ncbi:ATP-binding protein [Sphaerisporangium sp. NPDC051011]|uniref:ATP-binding protein n=1 Tax=Sphaerisporangium sp. NPDC051011 TaxID=3155792 RepID=UPI0033DB1D57
MATPSGILGAVPPSLPAPLGESVRLSPEILIWRRAFPGTPDQASEARKFVRVLLGGTAFASDSELIVGELAGNAIRHTASGKPGGHFTVEIAFRSSRRRPASGPVRAASVLLTVYDLGGGNVPRIRDDDRRRVPYGAEEDLPIDENGRGLAIVTAVADRVGYQGTPATGHRVWAYLTEGTEDDRSAWPTFERSSAPVAGDEVTTTIAHNVAEP